MFDNYDSSFVEHTQGIKCHVRVNTLSTMYQHINKGGQTYQNKLLLFLQLYLTQKISSISKYFFIFKTSKFKALSSINYLTSL